MNRIIFTILIFSSFSLNVKAQTKNFIDLPYLEVSGYADSSVVPNEIYIRINISEKDSRDRVSVEEYEIKMVEGLKGLGLNPEKDLSTNDLGSNYRFYLLKQKDVMKSKQYILKVADALTATKVFMLLESLEISNASIDRVDHSDKERIKNITRVKAVENAKLKAITLTKPLNQSVGQAIYITDNESNDMPLENRAPVMVAYGMRKMADADLPKIEFEKIKIATTVSIKFVIK